MFKFIFEYIFEFIDKCYTDKGLKGLTCMHLTNPEFWVKVNLLLEEKRMPEFQRKSLTNWNLLTFDKVAKCRTW